jgi:hypothetical protein
MPVKHNFGQNFKFLMDWQNACLEAFPADFGNPEIEVDQAANAVRHSRPHFNKGH